jgi:hypothetical protein
MCGSFHCLFLVGGGAGCQFLLVASAAAGQSVSQSVSLSASPFNQSVCVLELRRRREKGKKHQS